MRDALDVRTTLSLDDDVLEAVRSLAEQRKRSLGEVVSELVRQSLSPKHPGARRNGIRLFPVGEGVGQATPELVKELLEETD